MLNNIGPMGFILIAVVVLVLFGRGKISSMMGEVGKGITSFKRGLDEGKREVEDAAVLPPRDSATTYNTATSAGVPPIAVNPAPGATPSVAPHSAAAERRDVV